MNGRPRRENVIGIDVDRLIADRECGMSAREIAANHGITRGQLEYIIRATGKIDEWKAALEKKGERRRRKTMKISELLNDALTGHDEIVIERGLSGGYIASVDDVPGEERLQIKAALQNALRAASKVPQR